tara:strand:- start:44 stop:271 length:228 start_codon:yes stop_codon:yes gene_type:complete
MTHNDKMAKALLEFTPRIYDSRKPTKSPWQVKLAKFALLAYFGFVCFAIGYFTEFHPTGVDFFIEGIGGYFWEYK